MAAPDLPDLPDLAAFERERGKAARLAAAVVGDVAEALARRGYLLSAVDVAEAASVLAQVLCRPTTCGVCGAPLGPPTSAGQIQRWCSPDCRRRGQTLRRKYRRRALLHARPVEAFTLAEIAERDGWRCHLCGKPVEAADASLDHVIPVSQGGAHTRRNVALAHERCNSKRGNAPVQLHLTW